MVTGRRCDAEGIKVGVRLVAEARFLGRHLQQSTGSGRL